MALRKQSYLLAVFITCAISGCAKDEPIPADTITDIDGNVYHTVTIGDQVWMASNLKVTRYNDGTLIDMITDNSEWSMHNQGAYAWYNNDEATHKDVYGALYNGYAASSGKLCPKGWNVASYNDWIRLINYISGAMGPGGNMLKSCRQIDSPLSGMCATTQHPRWEADSVNYGSDEFGFAALPGGLRNPQGVFVQIGGGGYWHTSTLYREPNTIIYSSMYSSSERVLPRYSHISQGMCIRCIKDQ